MTSYIWTFVTIIAALVATIGVYVYLGHNGVNRQTRFGFVLAGLVVISISTVFKICTTLSYSQETAKFDRTGYTIYLDDKEIDPDDIDLSKYHCTFDDYEHKIYVRSKPENLEDKLYKFLKNNIVYR